ncbi:hypothetical protein SAMN06295888_11830 [Desulfonatronum zhilinae]|nr:hypothetical protein SAMN06295888_11830 [Desulfonatronum zhilinae]
MGVRMKCWRVGLVLIDERLGTFGLPHKKSCYFG